MADSLKEKLHADMVAAMKAKEKEKVGVLRMLIATLDAVAKDKRRALEEDEEIKLVMSYAKKREDAMAQMREAGRQDLFEKEEAELTIVRAYLPAPLDDAQLTELVEEIIAVEQAEGMKDMGRVVKACLARARGRADGGRISAAVKAKLSR